MKYKAAAIYGVSGFNFYLETQVLEGLCQHRFGTLPPSDEPSSSSDDEPNVSERKVSILFYACGLTADI